VFPPVLLASLCVLCELCVKPDLLFVLFRAFRGQGLGFSGHKMGRIDPICAPFVLQMGPITAMIDPRKGRKPPHRLTFVYKISGTSTKTWAKCPCFNDFCVPQNTWDKPGTTAGQAIQRDTKSFLKNREKTMKIGRKWLAVRYLRFSRGREKGVKISHDGWPRSAAFHATTTKRASQLDR
jgi:hypothetical protein